MPKKPPLTFVDRMKKYSHAGLRGPSPNRTPVNVDELPSLEDRVQKLLGIINQTNRPAGNMLFFVMYDIESNKVRRQVVKYLEKKGCFRVQKSIFLADLSNKLYDEIRRDLAEVQAAYDNNDSILVVPVSTDMLRSMKIIGQQIELDVIMHTKNTLFF